jgi:hypothetical protein
MKCVSNVACMLKVIFRTQNASIVLSQTLLLTSRKGNMTFTILLRDALWATHNSERHCTSPEPLVLAPRMDSDHSLGNNIGDYLLGNVRTNIGKTPFHHRYRANFSSFQALSRIPC